MHRFLVFLILGLAPSLVQAQTAATRLAPQKGWLGSLDQAKVQAKKTGKPIFLVFRCDP